MTDVQKCLDTKAAKAVVLTRPLAPASLAAVAGSEEARLGWSPPPGEGHSCLGGTHNSCRGNKFPTVANQTFVFHNRPVLLPCCAVCDWVAVGYQLVLSAKADGAEVRQQFVPVSAARALVLPRLQVWPTVD